MTTHAQAVQDYGQSIWIDYIHRNELQDGTFQRYIDEGVLGVTSNPTIFQKAIGDSDVYDEEIAAHVDEGPDAIYERLTLADIRAASDLFMPVYERTGGRDGYVSLEVSPRLAHDTDSTIEEARRLYAVVDRPNLMIKIPATEAGIPAIEAAIAEGINVNVTLIFSVANYEKVVEAYLRGLEKRLEAGESIDDVASVASFFLSRIDTAVDRILTNNIRVAQIHGDPGRIAANRRLLGQAAIANAKLAYQTFTRLFMGGRFKKLREAGAQVQRPLWASTGTKDPGYSDTRYVDRLIGADTVNTVPPKTYAAFQDHGTVAETINRNDDDYMMPDDVFDKLAELGIDIDKITRQLQEDGVDAFIESFETLLQQVQAKITVLKTGVMKRQLLALGIFAPKVTQAVTNMDKTYIPARVWSRDGTVWKDHGPTINKIRNRLGWLDVRETIDRGRLKALQADVKAAGFSHAVLMGMGGSSLAPEVMYHTFGQQAGFPQFTVLDNTDPVRVQAVADQIDMAKTLFIVASKSGTTTETQAFFRYFYDRTGENGQQFIAITDPDTPLVELSNAYSFRQTFLNPPDMAGRYSALSYFGMVPAAVMGLDLDRAWQHADDMIEACGEDIPGAFHPGVQLGAVMGVLAQSGRDKVTVKSTASLEHFGLWAEQLIAESTGKEGRGILPVVGSTVGKPHDYDTDRLFIYQRLAGDPDIDDTDAGIKALREAGHPRVTHQMTDTYELFGEFFRWEFATAIAGHLLKVNPFDEPHVNEAKEATRRLLDHYEEHGQLPHDTPLVGGASMQLYSDEYTLEPLREMCRSHGYADNSRTEVLAAQLAASHAGDYFAILAYFTPTDDEMQQLRDLQRRLRHVTKRAVTIGFGPRYLHSTGQLHKGGPNTGIFLVLTTDDSADLPVPGMPYTFRTLFDAQARGDLETLFKHRRRTMRLHITDTVTVGLNKLMDAVDFVEQRRF